MTAPTPAPPPVAISEKIDRFQHAIEELDAWSHENDKVETLMRAVNDARAALDAALVELLANAQRWRVVMPLLSKQLRSQHYADVNGPEMYLELGDAKLRTGSVGDYSDKLVCAAVDRFAATPAPRDGQ